MTPNAVDQQALPDFSGHVVVVYLRGDVSGLGSGVPLEYPEYRTYAGTVFIVGRSVGFRGTEWNIPTSIAWSSVAGWQLFKNIEDFNARMNLEHSFWQRLRWVFLPH